jgi:diadenosine tetraphosphatase ApaH/serine/threonine PP2A family protein phosphatase
MRALILSDIHGNLEALRAVLAAAEGTYDTVWNLGDVVGYGASPNEVADIVHDLASANVRGNHDKVCSGVDSAATFNTYARDAALWTREHLRPDTLAWLRDLPAGPIVPKGTNVALAHGSPIDEDIYIQNIRDAWLPLESMQQHCTFFGHTHVQGGFGWQDGQWFGITPKHLRAGESSAWVLPMNASRRYLLNPGSVGQPRDMDPRAAYAVYDSAKLNVTFYRVPYDIELAQGRILLAGLPERLAKRLREGR